MIFPSNGLKMATTFVITALIHAEKTPNEVAIIWEGDDPSNSKLLHIKN